MAPPGGDSQVLLSCDDDMESLRLEWEEERALSMEHYLGILWPSWEEVYDPSVAGKPVLVELGERTGMGGSRICRKRSFKQDLINTQRCLCHTYSKLLSKE